MQASKATDRRRLWVDFDFNSRGDELCSHFIEIAHPEIYHPDLLRIAEVLRLLRERTEHGGTRLLLPNWVSFAGGCKRDSQVLMVPASQGFGIVSPKEEASNSRYSFHLRFFGRCDS